MEKKVQLTTQELLASGKMGSLIARYAIPGAVGLVFFSLQSIVDGIIVGRLLGSDALAGVNIVMPTYTLLTAVSIILGVGAQAQMSIGMGQANYSKTKSAFKSGLIALMFFAVAYAILINVFPRTAAELLGADEHLMDYSVSYIRGVMPFIIANACFYYFDYVLKALGHPRFAMYIMIASIVLNVILSILFVAVLDMGTFGVGLGTGLSVLLGGVLSGWVSFRQMAEDKHLRMGKGHFSWRLLGRIFYNGSSEGVSEIAMGITLLAFNLSLMKYAGKDGVAAFSVINYLVFIGTSILLGISNGVVPVISFNHGAQLKDRIRQSVRIVIKSNFIIGLIFFIFLWVFGETLVSLFISSDGNKAVLDMAASGSKIIALGFFFNGFNIFCASFFTAVDNPKLSLLIAALRGIVFILIGIAVLPPLFGLNGIWMTVPVTELLTAVIAFYLIRQQR